MDAAHAHRLGDRWRAMLLWLVTLGGGAAFAVLLISLLGATQRANTERENAARWEIHTFRVMLTASELQSALLDAQRSVRGYAISGDPATRRVLRDANAKVERMARQLRNQTRDNPAQQLQLVSLDTLVGTQLERVRASETDIAQGRQALVLTQIRGGLGELRINELRSLIGKVVAAEQALLAARTRRLDAATEEARLAARALSVTGLLLFAIALIAGSLAVRGSLEARRALRAANDAARRREDLERIVAVRTAEIAAANVALRDEIERKNAAEAQVRQMQKLESVGQLTGGIAHDFNNMLAIVIGSLDLAMRRLEDPSGRVIKYIDNAMDGAKRAAALTARLLAFSRQQALAPEAIDANTFVGSISELLRRTLGETIRIETVLAGGLWRTYADAGELENAIANLAVNARDAMGGEGRLTIETANTHLDDAYAAENTDVEPGQYVVICVTDTGGGMPAEVIAKAFDPFFTTKQVGKGTGLGLSQVYGFVKQSGGHVKIYSEPGQGTTVKLYLPRWTGADTPERAPAPAGPLPRGRDGETILVVEDEPRVRLVTVDALRELGYVVVHASDGADALQRLEQTERVDLLFTDIVMPGMNGRELADAALVQRPGLKVLYTTGYTRNAVVHNGLLDAQVAFLAKPFSVEGLAVKVRAVLDGGGVNRAAA